MARPEGTGNIAPSFEKQREYARQLQREADGGNPIAAAAILLLNHFNAMPTIKNGKHTQEGTNNG